MHSVCCCSLPIWRRSSLKKGTLHDLFRPRPGSTPRRIWPQNNNTCKEPWVLHPYKVSSKSIKRFWRRSRKCEKFTDDGRTDRQTDRRTDDGGCAMTIAHSSLRLRWAKKYVINRYSLINRRHSNSTCFSCHLQMFAYSEIRNFSDGDSHDFMVCVLCDLFLKGVKDDISSVTLLNLCI